MKRNYLYIAFAVTVLAQLAIPAMMIYDSEMTERHGTIFRFKTVPIDPTDPFRGKYITLDYEISAYPTADTTFTSGDNVYVTLANDTKGYATIASIAHDAPENKKEYILAEVNHNYGGKMNIEFPFTRFYMEESKAPEAETAYAEYSRDTLRAKPAYSLVAVKDGNAVIKDVIIDGIPIKDYVLKEREKK